MVRGNETRRLANCLKGSSLAGILGELQSFQVLLIAGPAVSIAVSNGFLDFFGETYKSDVGRGDLSGGLRLPGLYVRMFGNLGLGWEEPPRTTEIAGTRMRFVHLLILPHPWSSSLYKSSVLPSQEKPCHSRPSTILPQSWTI